ncbi:hypothetical protein, partial [Duncaniella muris]|uniref:hypothetical protein n=2 Tax=Duncaniella muris TaxID=2094150 RepID=UPI0025B582B5
VRRLFQIVYQIMATYGFIAGNLNADIVEHVFAAWHMTGRTATPQGNESTQRDNGHQDLRFSTHISVQNYISLLK